LWSSRQGSLFFLKGIFFFKLVHVLATLLLIGEIQSYKALRGFSFPPARFFDVEAVKSHG
jgi:hypothetical protein